MLYLFQLGHQPQISAAEIIETLHATSLLKNDNNHLLIELKGKIDAQKLINRLGGTVKIAIAIPSSKEDKGYVGPINQLTNYLINAFPTGKIEFSINDRKLATEIKKQLKSLNRSVRYIEPKNTATILHNKLAWKKSDLTIFDNKIFATEAIQPFEEFSARDYGRPAFDEKSGMLPPKLAKIMINLAVSCVETQNFASLPNDNIAILDPFCGSGTILTEAVVMGYTNLTGSDISEKAISDTKKNLQWTNQQYKNITMEKWGNIKLHVADACNLSNLLKPNSIDAIVTEPYLGQPLRGNETENHLKKQTSELKNLYINSFKEFHKILKPNGVVVFIIPKFQFKNDWVKINCVEEIKKNGFEILPFINLNSSLSQREHAHCRTILNLQSLTYHRPNQHLAREIWRFKKIPI